MIGAAALIAATLVTPVKRIDGTTITPAKIEATVNRLMDAAHVTGLSVAILNNNRVVYLRSFGLASVEKQKPLRTDSVVYAASFTKSLFAYFVMQLVDEGVIDLDTPIERDLPKPLPEYGHNKRTGVRAAGSMDTTIDDYAKFIAAVMQKRGVSEKSWKEMFRPQIAIRSKAQFPTLRNEFTDENHAIRLSYGLGVGVFRTPHGPAFFKEGHDDGWENHFLVFPDRKIGIVLMSNSSNGDRIFIPLMKELIGDRWTPAGWEGYVPYK